MTYLQAIVLGIIQGLTEFLPISSTAHLRVVPALLNWKDPGAAFTAVIQWGTLLATIIYFWQDIVRLLAAVLDDLRRGRLASTFDSKLAWMIAVGSVPIVACGLLFKKHIETTLRSLYVISAAAIGLAVVLIVAEWLARRRRLAHVKEKELPDVGWGETLLVGCAQAVALIPGASRSGVTITGGLFAGLSRDTAARFSFLLSLPAIFGAGLYELYKERHELLASRADAVNLLLALVVSGVVGYASIAFLLRYLKTHTTHLFIVYRLALGSVLLVLLARGVLHDDTATAHAGAAGSAALSQPTE